MSIYRGVYFSALTGAIGGLLAWALAALITSRLTTSRHEWLPDALVLVCFGVFVGGLLFAHLDRAAGKRIRGKNIWYGTLLGLGFAVLGSLLAVFLREKISSDSPLAFRLTVWVLASSLISLGLGLRWSKTNRPRVLHTYAGGLFGSLLGGLLFVALAAHTPMVVQAAGLMLAGAGTGFGAAIAPVLIQDGLMKFISSGDARAQSKFGRTQKEWALDPDESYVLGSLATEKGSLRFQQGADIFIPDSSIAPRHAVLFSKEGRFYIARHPEAGGPQGIAKYVLRVRGKTIVTSRELQPADDLLIGRTALRFESRKDAL